MRSFWGENLKGRIPMRGELDWFIQSWSLVNICVCVGVCVIICRMWCWSLTSVLKAVLGTWSRATGREENLLVIFINTLSTWCYTQWEGSGKADYPIFVFHTALLGFGCSRVWVMTSVGDWYPSGDRSSTGVAVCPERGAWCWLDVPVYLLMDP